MRNTIRIVCEKQVVIQSPIHSVMKKVCASYKTCQEEKKLLFEKKGYPILECKKCGHRYIQIPDHEDHLSNVYSDDYFFDGKDGYPNYLDYEDLLVEQGIRYAILVDKYVKPGKVLDVGSAAGFILKGFEKYGWSCQGIEPNETMAAYGREKLNLDIKTGSIEAFETTEKFDLVNMIQVIGHVYDLDKALQNVTRLLKPGGIVLVESWNMKSAAAKILGKRWHEYSPPSVVHWYSDKTLTLLLNYYGFELIGKGYPLKKISLEHAFSFLEGKTSSPTLKRMVRYLNRLSRNFVLTYPLLDLKWYVFRK